MTISLWADDTPAECRRRLADLSERISTAGSKNDLLDHIDSALSVSAPQGDSLTLESLSKTYRDQAEKIDDVYKRVHRVARKGLPEVWVGDTSVLASGVVSAAGRSATQMVEAFQGGAKALLKLADALGDAQRQDVQGRARLRQARASWAAGTAGSTTCTRTTTSGSARKQARGIASDGVFDDAPGRHRH